MLSFCHVSAAKLGTRAVSLSDPSFQVENLEQKPFTLTRDFGSADLTLSVQQIIDVIPWILEFDGRIASSESDAFSVLKLIHYLIVLVLVCCG